MFHVALTTMSQRRKTQIRENGPIKHVVRRDDGCGAAAEEALRLGGRDKISARRNNLSAQILDSKYQILT